MKGLSKQKCLTVSPPVRSPNDYVKGASSKKNRIATDSNWIYLFKTSSSQAYKRRRFLVGFRSARTHATFRCKTGADDNDKEVSTDLVVIDILVLTCEPCEFIEGEIEEVEVDDRLAFFFLFLLLLLLFLLLSLLRTSSVLPESISSPPPPQFSSSSSSSYCIARLNSGLVDGDGVGGGGDDGGDASAVESRELRGGVLAYV